MNGIRLSVRTQQQDNPKRNTERNKKELAYNWGITRENLINERNTTRFSRD
jgi:hypothetical protein